MRPSLGRRIFEAFNYTFFILLSLACIFPVIHVLALSFSTSTSAAAGKVVLWPVDFTTEAYRYTLSKREVFSAMGISFQRTLLGTAINLVLTIFAAYPLSKEKIEFRSRIIYVWYFVITILISGGMIPSYIIMKELGLLNSLWALILPGAVSVFSVVVLLNFFRGLPRDMVESAFVDGAGHMRVLWQLYVPLSMPSLATLILLNAVGHWNSWFDGIIYMTSPKNYPMQSYLRTILFTPQLGVLSREDALRMRELSDKTIKCAQIFIATLPILAVYPFLQRYFVTGLTLGSVKG